MAPLGRNDFDDSFVLTTENFHPTFGFCYGPIPLQPLGSQGRTWLPPRQNAARDANHPQFPLPKISRDDNNDHPPNRPSPLSAINGLICTVGTHSNPDTMCGVICVDQSTLLCHIRQHHPGAIMNKSTKNTPMQEKAIRTNALRNWVVTGGWRDAQFVNEPGRGILGGLLDEYATACEVIAARDQDFAQRFGRRFHRWYVTDAVVTLSSSLDRQVQAPGHTSTGSSSQAIAPRDSTLLPKVRAGARQN